MRQYTVFLNATKYLRLIEEVQLSVIVHDTWFLQVTFCLHILSLDASRFIQIRKASHEKV